MMTNETCIYERGRMLGTFEQKTARLLG